MRNFLFKEFCAPNLGADIMEVVSFDSEERESLVPDIQKYIIPRLKIFCGQTTIYYYNVFMVNTPYSQ